MSEKIEKKSLLTSKVVNGFLGVMSFTGAIGAVVALEMGWIDKPQLPKNFLKSGKDQERKLTANEISKLQSQNRKMFEWLSGVCNSSADNERNSDCQSFFSEMNQLRPGN
jgi:hypothetical protein